MAEANETLDVNEGSAATPVAPSPTEETPGTQPETKTPETEEPSQEPATEPDDSGQEPTQEEPEESKTVPYSRFQEVVRERDEARSQSQPVQPATAYKSLDPAVGYPTDPLEYADWVARGATQRAETSIELNEFSSKYNDLVSDPDPIRRDTFIGGVIGVQRGAAARGVRLTFAQAADQYLKVAEGFRKEGIEEARNGEVAKSSATVSSSKSKSSITGSNVKKLTADEFASLPKSEQAKRYSELVANYTNE